jgi:hypothetical protein
LRARSRRATRRDASRLRVTSRPRVSPMI